MSSMNSMNMSMINLEVDHLSYRVRKLPTEKSISRMWFIIKFRPMNDYQLHTVEKLSKYWYYHKLLNCGYSAHINRKINFY